MRWSNVDVSVRRCKLTNDYKMKTFGERIRELREKQDLSVRELAKKLKVSASFVSDMELGRRYPSDDVLERLASELDTTIGDLRSMILDLRCRN